MVVETNMMTVCAGTHVEVDPVNSKPCSLAAFIEWIKLVALTMMPSFPKWQTHTGRNPTFLLSFQSLSIQCSCLIQLINTIQPQVFSWNWNILSGIVCSLFVYLLISPLLCQLIGHWQSGYVDAAFNAPSISHVPCLQWGMVGLDLRGSRLLSMHVPHNCWLACMLFAV